MTDGQGSHGYGYDDNDALTNETTTYTGLPAKSVGYTFHPDGSRATMTTPAGTFQCGYDAAQRMTSVTNPFGETTQWGYLNNDWLKTQQLHNNATSTWTYDALARITDLVSRSGPGAMDPLRSSFTGLTYDGASNRLSLTASIPHHPAFDGTTNYQYDTKDQLTQETSTRAGGYTNNFGYDLAGNPTTFKGASATFNSNNQRTSDVHDGNGNPTTYKDTALTFDVENRMTGYGTVMTAGYRGDGLRAWKQTAAGRVYFLYDGELLLAEMDPSGAVTAVNTWGAAGLVSRNSAGGTVYYTFDPHGSVAQRHDSPGTVLTSHLWDAHGAGAASASYADPYGHGAIVGYRLDSENDLYLCTFRHFDPVRGRFVTRDPIGYSGGINVYAYVRNRAGNLVDPSGLASLKDILKAIVDAAARSALNVPQQGPEGPGPTVRPPDLPRGERPPYISKPPPGWGKRPPFQKGPPPRPPIRPTLPCPQPPTTGPQTTGPRPRTTGPGGFFRKGGGGRWFRGGGHYAIPVGIAVGSYGSEVFEGYGRRVSGYLDEDGDW